MKKTLSLLMMAMLGMAAWASDVTFDFGQITLPSFTYDANYNRVASVTNGDVTMTLKDGSGDNTPVIRTSATAAPYLQMYKGNTIAFQCDYDITKIVFTATADGNRSNTTVDTGSYDYSTGTWEGQAKTVTFTNPYRSGGNWMLESVLVTIDNPNTGISDIKAAQAGVTYVNLMGQTSTEPFNGVNIVVQNGKAIGKVVK